MATLGLDVSDQYTSYCQLDSSGIVAEEGRLRTIEGSLRKRFADFEGRVVLEAGTHSPWISRLFKEAGNEVIVANPRRVQLIAQSTRKNDKTDAETLARLGRLDPRLLAPVIHRSAQAQADLALIRSRNALISARTVLINHVRGAVKSVGGRLPSCDSNSFHRKARPGLPESLWASMGPLLNAIEKLTEEIKAADRRVLDLIESRYPEARALQQVAGVGPLISLAFILTIAYRQDGRRLPPSDARQRCSLHSWLSRTGLRPAPLGPP